MNINRNTQSGWIKLIFVMILISMTTGCASQQWAQQHWNQIASLGVASGYSSGVSIRSITVNGSGYTVIAPAGTK